MSRRIPVTILSGYLGAGKTTIINRALTGEHGIRLGVLVNDFGPVNIDASLIAATGEDLIELSNGCVCCSIGDDLGMAMSALAARPNPPDRLLLEASGVAEPARIAMTAGNWPGFELDAVIVAADTETVQKRAHDKYVGCLIRSQLAAADLIVLTKGDLSGPDRIADVTTWLRSLHPQVRIVPAVDGHVALEVLLGEARNSSQFPAHGHSHAHFSSSVWRPRGPVDAGRLAATLMAFPASVHRVKGYVTDASSGDRILVQSVGQRCELTPAEPRDSTGLVLISCGPKQELDVLCEQLDRLTGQ